MNEKTTQWLEHQTQAIREHCGRRLGRAPLIEGVLNALAESRIDFSDCGSISEVAGKLNRLLRARFQTPPSFHL